MLLNVRSLVSVGGILPPTSPLRRSLFRHLGTGLSSSIASSFFGLSPQTISRARQTRTGNTLLRLRSYPGLIRCRVDPHRLELSRRVINELLPGVSGKPWRVQMQTDEGLYHIYANEMASHGEEPLSPRALTTHILSKIADSSLF